MGTIPAVPSCASAGLTSARRLQHLLKLPYHFRGQSQTLRNRFDTTGKERRQIAGRKQKFVGVLLTLQLCRVVNTVFVYDFCESAVRVIGKKPARRIDDEELLLQQPR